jgi:hypothetical protein
MREAKQSPKRLLWTKLEALEEARRLFSRDQVSEGLARGRRGRE